MPTWHLVLLTSQTFLELGPDQENLSPAIYNPQGGGKINVRILVELMRRPERGNAEA